MDGQTQTIRAQAAIEIPLTDLSSLSAADRVAKLDALREAAVSTPFVLERGPLYRFELIRITDQEHLVFLTMHHIVCDGFSTGVLLKDLSELYSAISERRPPDLPEPASFADYAVQHARGTESEDSMAYWADRLRDPPAVVDLPADRPRPPQKTYRAGRVQHDLDPALATALVELAADHHCTLFALIFSAFTAYLERLTDQQDLVVPIVAAGHGARRPSSASRTSGQPVAGSSPGQRGPLIRRSSRSDHTSPARRL